MRYCAGRISSLLIDFFKRYQLIRPVTVYSFFWRSARRTARWVQRRFGSERPIRLARLAGDRRDWPEAIHHYRSYLDRHDTPPAWVLVQLGHALKENGSPDAAIASYERAVVAHDDTDALRHLAYLLAASGCLQEAYEAFDRLYRREGDASLRRRADQIALGLRRLDHRSPAEESGALRDLLQSVAEGLDIVDVRGLARGRDGTMLVLDQPCWVEFTINVGDNTPLALFQLEGSTVAPDQLIAGRLYCDFGFGFRETDPIELDGDSLRVPIVAPALISRMRWSPSHTVAELRVDRLGIVTMTPGEAGRLVADRFGDDLAAGCDLPGRLLQGPVKDEREAVSLQRLFDGRAHGPIAYARWRRRHIEPDEADCATIAAMIDAMPTRPVFSIVMPVYNPPAALLVEAIESIRAQSYPDWELCIADDASSDLAIRAILTRHAAEDARIKILFRPDNGHISAASNSALSIATGSHIALVDHDDLLPSYALFVAATYINRFPHVAILFSDEDKVDEFGLRYSPYMKGSFDRYLMYGYNMISHLGIYRKDLLDQVGGFRIGFEGSQDYDLALRCLDRIDERHVVHIPHVLYHWRAIAGSTSIAHDQKGYAITAAHRALDDHFVRRGMTARSVDGFAPGVSAIALPAVGGEATISVIVSAPAEPDRLVSCVASLLAIGDARLELIVVVGGSRTIAMVDDLADLCANRLVKIVAGPSDRNVPASHNIGAAAATGTILCFLDGVLRPAGGLAFARAQALLSDPQVGLVGVRLLDQDGMVREFGFGLGMGENRIALSLHAGFDGTDPGYFGKARVMQEFAAVSAGCLFVRAQDFTHLGGFDVRLARRYYDIDLCLRFRRHGYRVIGDAGSTFVAVERKGGIVDHEAAVIDDRGEEAALMRRRWASELDADPFISPNRSLDGKRFSFAEPPRVPMPWRSSSF